MSAVISTYFISHGETRTFISGSAYFNMKLQIFESKHFQTIERSPKISLFYLREARLFVY